MTFEEWIDDLEENVVQGEYGYEPGEFTVYPSLWRGSFDEGLTPSEAFKRALNAFADGRKQDEADRKRNYERIQEADRLTLTSAHCKVEK